MGCNVCHLALWAASGFNKGANSGESASIEHLLCRLLTDMTGLGTDGFTALGWLTSLTGTVNRKAGPNST